MKTNRDKNKEHDSREILRVRPKQAPYEFKALEDVIRSWVTGNK
jgi:hypothetical protein